MNEVTIKIDDEVYEFYRAIADDRNDMNVEEIIAAAVREHYEWELLKRKWSYRCARSVTPGTKICI
jgi:ribbon-helix-helix protein, copG family